MLAARYAWCTPDAFVELTMRQVQGFLKVINKAVLIEDYKRISSYATVHGSKLPPLDEILGEKENSSDNNKSSFDSKTDAALEAYAIKRLNEGKKLGK